MGLPCEVMLMGLRVLTCSVCEGGRRLALRDVGRGCVADLCEPGVVKKT